MGSEPSTSVVNKYLQSWDVSSLFVVRGGRQRVPAEPRERPHRDDRHADLLGGR